MAENDYTLKQAQELLNHVIDQKNQMMKRRAEAFKEVDKMPPEQYLKAKEIVDHFEKRGKQLNDQIKELTQHRDRMRMEEKKKDIEKDKNRNRDWDRER